MLPPSSLAAMLAPPPLLPLRGDDFADSKGGLALVEGKAEDSFSTGCLLALFVAVAAYTPTEAHVRLWMAGLFISRAEHHFFA